MKRTELLSAILPVFLLTGCTEETKPVQPKPASMTVSDDIAGNEQAATAEKLAVIAHISANTENPVDSLMDLAKRAGDITIASLGKESRIINMWYGGSYEDIFAYAQNKNGSYKRVLSLAGALHFKVLDKTDHGLKRIQITNARNLEQVVFQYNGKAYSDYVYKGSKRSVTDPGGVHTLDSIEIYSNIN